MCGWCLEIGEIGVPIQGVFPSCIQLIQELDKQWLHCHPDQGKIVTDEWMHDALWWTGIPIQEIFRSYFQRSQNRSMIHHNLDQDKNNMSEDAWMHDDAQGDQILSVSIGAEWWKITSVHPFIFRNHSILVRIALDPRNTGAGACSTMLTHSYT